MARKTGTTDYGWKPFETQDCGKKKQKHFRMAFSMWDSPAWLDLSNNAKVLYMDIKAREYKGYNENEIKYPYKDGEKLMNRRTFIKARNELINNGFIKIVYDGYAERVATVYAFSSEWKYYGTPAFSVEVKESNLTKVKDKSTV